MPQVCANNAGLTAWLGGGQPFLFQWTACTGDRWTNPSALLAEFFRVFRDPIRNSPTRKSLKGSSKATVLCVMYIRYGVARSRFLTPFPWFPCPASENASSIIEVTPHRRWTIAGCPSTMPANRDDGGLLCSYKNLRSRLALPAEPRCCRRHRRQISAAPSWSVGHVLAVALSDRAVHAGCISGGIAASGRPSQSTGGNRSG